MTVYTGRGDTGSTDLFGGERVSKASPRIESYGTVDELNALIGTIRPTGAADIDHHLGVVQHDLHVVQAQLATPDPDQSDTRIRSVDVDRLEDWIDRYERDLVPLDHFILPGGGVPGSRLHHARTVCRRAERRVVDLGETADVHDQLMIYLNRLSDLLFVLARVVNARDGVSEERPDYDRNGG